MAGPTSTPLSHNADGGPRQGEHGGLEVIFVPFRASHLERKPIAEPR
jgi:hypothetical protein